MEIRPSIPSNDTQKLENMERMKNKDSEQLKDACREFEAIFLNMMMKQMRNTIPEGGMTEKSYGRETFEEMQDEILAEEMSKGQGVGLAKQLYEQLSGHTQIKNQE